MSTMTRGRWALAVLPIALAVGCQSTSTGSDGSSGPSNSQLGAFDVCKQFVRDQLKAPGTASFRDPFGNQAPTFDGDGKGPITVTSSVDSENGFGAKLRSGFTCTVTNTGGDNWHLDDISLDDGGS